MTGAFFSGGRRWVIKRMEEDGRRIGNRQRWRLGVLGAEPFAVSTAGDRLETGVRVEMASVADGGKASGIFHCLFPRMLTGDGKI